MVRANDDGIRLHFVQRSQSTQSCPSSPPFELSSLSLLDSSEDDACRLPLPPAMAPQAAERYGICTPI
jgi:hypothetical protein